MKTDSMPGRSRLGSGASGAERAPAAPGLPGDAADAWLLQAEAAELAGCSVSAIRKWRREGSVAFRRTATPGGMERVEVRLGDVLVRAGKRTLVPPSEAPDAVAAVPAPAAATVVSAPAAGTVVVSLSDLQAMFERLGGSNHQTSEIQAHYRALESEVSYMRSQVARLGPALEDRSSARQRAEALERRVGRLEAETERLRRELAALRRELEGARRSSRPRYEDRHEAASGHGTGPVPSAPPPSEAPMPEAPAAAAPPALAATASEPAAPPPAASRASFEGWLERRTPPEKTQAPAGPPIERLAAELGQLYQALANRPRTAAGAEERARWASELRRYDTVLVRACSRLGIATEHRPGDRLTAPDRVALTRALADAGLDVRRSPASAQQP